MDLKNHFLEGKKIFSYTNLLFTNKSNILKKKSMKSISPSTRKCDTALKAILLRSPILLDVRTHAEYVGCNIPNSRNITPFEIPVRLAEIKSWNKPVVLYSQYGLRSKLVYKILKRAKVEVYDACSKNRVAALLNFAS